MNCRPLVSIIVPAYNAEAVLHAALKSIEQQTWGYWEAIIVDDGSNDRTAAIAAEFVRADARFRLIRQENKGVAAARNTALVHCQGEWIAFIDADDIWLPQKLEQQWRTISLHRNCDFVYSNYLIWDGVTDSGMRYSTSKKMPAGDVRKRLPFFNLFGISSVLLKRELIERAGGFDQSVAPGEDWDMWLRIAENGFCPRGIFEPLLRYRVWPGNASGDPLKMARVNVEVLEKGLARNLHTPLAPLYGNALNVARGKLELASARDLIPTSPDIFREAVKKAWKHSPKTSKWLLWHAALNCPHWLGGEIFRSAVLKKIARK